MGGEIGRKMRGESMQGKIKDRRGEISEKKEVKKVRMENKRMKERNDERRKRKDGGHDGPQQTSLSTLKARLIFSSSNLP